ncbi:redoxin domain-containing protein [Foetidibacter luteolus]|uniref:redoxin domain-containing protein n=1 Tax=Foetidibacter luteolus TaxID=2608880 RepID=UPI001A98C08F|nr:redoxin domain-containing protein [Foetidibacter luteolus]
MSTIVTGSTKLRPVNPDDLLSAQSRHYGYYPLIKGNTAPSFYLHGQDGIARHLASGTLSNELFISIQDFLDYQQPLVLTFYNGRQGQEPAVKALESLQADIQVMGGRLVVLTNTSARYFKKALRHQNNLTIFYDRDNAIAELFGLYDAFNPLWQWVSGVEQDDLPLPAFYVISPDRQIAWHHIDYNLLTYTNDNFAQQPFVRDLLTAVYHTHQRYSYQPVQYRSVS